MSELGDSEAGHASPRGRRLANACVFFLATLALSVGLPPRGAPAATLPEGFVDTEVLDGLELPTAVRFSPDGQVFVAEKSGLLKVFDGLSDDQPEVFADLRLQVNDYYDRGLLGLELDPEFPADPYVYVLYTHDAEIGGAAPRWGTAQGGDDCPYPPGGLIDGCVVSGRLSRLTAEDGAMVGSERILVEDWCQQFWSHSVGALAFDSDGALYASAGDGASAALTDYGQAGSPRNPCGDPPGGVGVALAPPSAEGGALRSQDLRTPSDPLGLDGSIIRVDPETGAGLPDNPLGLATDENQRRLVAHGFRNPFRFALRPGTDELWVGDVGWESWEEVNRLEAPSLGGPVPNAGWPCYEGPDEQVAWASLGMATCLSLYADPGQVTGPFYAYPIRRTVPQGEDCPADHGSAISALAFYGQGGFPQSYEGALFFGDYARRCIWVMPVGADGDPDPGEVSMFEQGSGSAVDLQTGPGGDLFYADILAGSIRRISFFEGNRPPTAFIEASPTDGPVDPPLVVHLDASASSDPDQDPLEFAWDFDEDGEFDDAAGPAPSPLSFTEKGDRVLRLRVSDGELEDTAVVTIHAGNSRPMATILSPDIGELWEAGQPVQFSGEATDPDDGPLSGAALTWSVILEHCPQACHEHFMNSATGSTGQVVGPNHEYPAGLVLRLTARDSGGLKASDEIELHPRTTEIALRSEPAGATLTLGSFSAPAPFARAVIRGSLAQVSAPRSAEFAGLPAPFLRWSDGVSDFLDPVHAFQALGDKNLTAFYRRPARPGDAACSDAQAPASVLRRGGVRLGPWGVRLRGRASDHDCGPAGVQSAPPRVFVYVALLDGRREKHCRFLRPDGALTPASACRAPLLLPANGFARFSRLVKAQLPSHGYLAGALAVDGSGNWEQPGAANRVVLRRRAR